MFFLQKFTQFRVHLIHYSTTLKHKNGVFVMRISSIQEFLIERFKSPCIPRSLYPKVPISLFPYILGFLYRLGPLSPGPCICPSIPRSLCPSLHPLLSLSPCPYIPRFIDYRLMLWTNLFETYIITILYVPPTSLP